MCLPGQSTEKDECSLLKITDFERYDKENAYWGDDLGATLSESSTRFCTWSPEATAVYVNIYADGTGDNRVESLPMLRGDRGAWSVEILRPLDGYFYTYTFEFDYRDRFETIDIYAKACGVNGDRGAIIDFSKTNPADWDTVPRPSLESPCDAVIYECHVRDFSVDASSGVAPELRGKFAAFYAENTDCGGAATCLAHFKELGITHVHLLPCFDYATVDEAKLHRAQYNWGYDPKNYNCPEGSYSTDPADPYARVREFKLLVSALHENGIGVIMDVVYNHTYETEKSAFHRSFPGYYHRRRGEQFSNGSGCGNETATEHLMFRKFMFDSLKFWMTEYKIDGFRFDLMGLHDIETMNILRRELKKLHPQLLLYGEGWTGGDSPVHSSKLALKYNAGLLPGIGLFNDNLRDAVKGETFNAYGMGFVSGNYGSAPTIRRGIAGSCAHHQLYGVSTDACWALSPEQAVNYCEAHDNLTLWDKLSVSAKHYPKPIRERMDKLAAAVIFLSQGIPFLQLGQDFLRKKPRFADPAEAADKHLSELDRVVENSYNAPDFTNSIKWDRKTRHADVFAYYKALVALRRENPLLRLRSGDEINACLHFHPADDPAVVVYSLERDGACLIVCLNPHHAPHWFDIPAQLTGDFRIRLGDPSLTLPAPVPRRICAAPIAALVLERIRQA
ncbi:MAG: type I pullulanase [Oscillospiraceae bacterium]